MQPLVTCATRKNHRYPKVRNGQGDVKLSRAEFDRQLGERLYDPAFDSARAELECVMASLVLGRAA